jgi:hypothetical protein
MISDNQAWELSNRLPGGGDFHEQKFPIRPALEYAHGTLCQIFIRIKLVSFSTGWGRLERGDFDEHDVPIRPALDYARRVRVLGANAWSLNVVFSQPKGVERAG